MAALLHWLGITIDPVVDFGEEFAFHGFQWVLCRSSSRRPASKEFKPWRFITSSLCLTKNLAILKCTHSTRAPLQGKWTRKSAFYQEPLCNLMIQSLFPHVINQHLCSMPCVAKSNQSHRQKLVPAWVPFSSP